MNTDIAGLCERLRDRVAFCKQSGGVYTYGEDDYALDNEAADTLERQAAEIERLRRALEKVAAYYGLGHRITEIARAALTGEGP